MIIFRIACTYFAVPVKREPYFIQLLPIAVDILYGCNSRVLPCLDSILFGRQAVCVISHRIQYIETLQAFVAGVNVRSNISQRMSYM